jgi:hypothetical protein
MHGAVQQVSGPAQMHQLSDIHTRTVHRGDTTAGRTHRHVFRLGKEEDIDFATGAVQLNDGSMTCEVPDVDLAWTCDGPAAYLAIP